MYKLPYLRHLAYAVIALCLTAVDMDAARASNAPTTASPKPAADAQGAKHGDMSDSRKLAAHINEYKAKAEQGDPNAQFNLAIAYTMGIGGRADKEKAAEWMKKASDGFRQPAYANDKDAMYMLGSIYAMGMGGITPDLAVATRWWERAADLGDVRAQMTVAAMYSSGKSGVPLDKVAADKWLYIAAASGDMHADGMRVGMEKSMNATEIAKAQDESSAWKQKHKL